MRKLTLGSLFDGSGGFALGGILSGINPIWASEIEPFPIRVTSKRLPDVQHLGDINQINGAKITPVDIITFGSPCTDMSLAGRRAGLVGSQSILFYQAIRIIKEMRNATDGKYPRYIVWENVPGAFSSNKGDDFKAVLEAICKIKTEDAVIPELKGGKWSNAGNIVAEDFSLAWRVFDAQYWGVPQRRRRIYLVADFAGGSAGEILFESEGLSGYSKKGRCPWQKTAGGTEACLGETGTICLNDQGGERMDVTEDKTSTLRAKSNHPPLVFENHSQDSRFVGPLDKAQTVLATFGTGGNNQPFVMETPKTLKIRSGCEGGGKGALVQDNLSATLACNNDQTVFVPKAYCICSKDSNSMKSDNPDSGFYEADSSRTIDGNGGNPACNQGGMAVVENMTAFHVNQRDEIIDLKGKSGALMARQSNQIQTFVLQGSMIGRKDENGPQGDGVNEGVSFTLNTVDKHVVAFAEKHATLSANDGPKGPSSQMLASPEENFVAEPAYGIDRAAFNQGENAKFNFQIEEEVEPTIISRGPNAVASPIYSLTTGSFMQVNQEMAPTLAARDYKDAPVVNYMDEPKYIVRRLTPTECARLQGFPDWWCSDLGIENPSEEDISFWTEVFETHRRIMGTAKKPKSRNQIIKWLKNPHSDSAEYKMWGNGVALPCVCFVLAGIVWSQQD